MSALAKVFIVVNFLLSLVFFGTSATLFLTRKDLIVQYETYKADAERRIDELSNRLREKDEYEGLLEKALVRVRESESNLASALAEKQREITALEGKLAVAESQRTKAEQQATAALNALREKEDSNQQLLQAIDKANRERDEALLARKQAVEERNRWKRELDKVTQELHVAMVTYKDLEEKYQELELRHAALVKKVGADVEDVVLAPPIDARVEAVDPQNGLVVLSSGRDQNVKPGYNFTIYRNGEFIGKVRVTRVFSDQSGAEVIFTKDGAQIRRGDRATTTLFSN